MVGFYCVMIPTEIVSVVRKKRGGSTAQCFLDHFGLPVTQGISCTVRPQNAFLRSFGTNVILAASL
jgi:hypothetical protein